MDLLGFSSEELDKINNTKSSPKKTEEFSPKIDAIPDLSSFSESVRLKYMQTRDSEIFRLKSRHYNQHPPAPPNEKSLSSQLPRIQKFVKKLKTLAEDNKEELVKEVMELSLKKFISEAAHGLSENKMQLKDLQGIIEVACKLHQTYPDFQKMFESNLKKQHKEAEMIRKRNILRLVVEMVCFGLWSDVKGFLKVVRDYVRFY